MNSVKMVRIYFLMDHLLNKETLDIDGVYILINLVVSC